MALIDQLQRVLGALPENDMAIIRQEGLALYHQLTGDIALAIEHRKKEIQLTEFLHDDVRRCFEAGKYDEKTVAFALQGRDLRCLEERRALLRALEQEAQNADASQNGSSEDRSCQNPLT